MNSSIRVGLVLPEITGISKVFLSQYCAILERVNIDFVIVTKNGMFDSLTDVPVEDAKAVEDSGLLSLARAEWSVTQSILELRDKVDAFLLAQTRGSFLLPQLAARMTRSKLVVLTGGTLSKCLIAQRSPGVTKSALVDLIRCLEATTYFLADTVVIYSAREIQDKWGLGGFRNKVRVCPRHFVDFEMFSMGPPASSRRRRVGFAGRLAGEKGICEFVETAKMDSDGSNEYTVAGDGPLRSLVGQACIQTKNLVWLGPLDRGSVAQMMKDLRILVIPSFTEGLPNVMLEAMAAGAIVITTDVGAVSDIIDDGVNGYVIKDNRPKTIQEKIVRVQNDPRIDQVQKDAQKTVSELFSLDVSARRFGSMLREVL